MKGNLPYFSFNPKIHTPLLAIRCYVKTAISCSKKTKQQCKCKQKLSKTFRQFSFYITSYDFHHFSITNLRWPVHIYMRVICLIRVSQNERFNRFLRFFASFINNNETLRKYYLFSYRYKSVWDIGIYLKPHFYDKWK